MPDAPDTLEDHKAILRRANARVAAGDHEGFLAHCTEDTTWEFVGDQTLAGKAAVRAYMKEAYVHPPRFDVKDMVAEGDLVVVTGQITLTDAHGAETTSRYCDLWRFEGDKLADLRAFVVEGAA